MDWISIKDRSPEKNTNVLVFTGMAAPNDIMIGHINNHGFWWDEEANFMQIPVVSWMPLPEPPKE